MTNTRVLPTIDVDPSLEDEITPICNVTDNSGWIRRKHKPCQEKAKWIVYFTCPTEGRMLGGCPAGPGKFGYACHKHRSDMIDPNRRVLCSDCGSNAKVTAVQPI